MDDFTYDCWQKKKLAQQARYRKCGSKSRKCSLPSDRLTKKQWKERNGETVSINLNQPTTWENFKKLSKPTQEEYIRHLMETYGANATSLAALFQVRPLTVRRFLQSRQLAIKFPVGHSMSAAQREAWTAFLNGDTICESSPAQQAEESSPDVFIPDQADSAMSMSAVSLSFKGKINAAMIANSLLKILGDNASGEVEITCRLL